MLNLALNDFRPLIGWLFEKCPEGYEPQTGYADSQKKAIAWFPGRKPGMSMADAQRIGMFAGATQVAFPVGLHTYEPDTMTYLCWLGIDLDAKDQVKDFWTHDLSLLAPWSVRYSAGGKGRHLIARLENPVLAPVSAISGIIRTLAAETLLQLAQTSVVVDKADRRMFWLIGGDNAWEQKRGEFLANEPREYRTVAVAPTPEPKPLEPKLLASEADLTAIFTALAQAGVPVIQGSANVSLRTVVPILQKLGYNVQTKSPMTRDTVNAQFHFSPDHVSLYSFSDSRTIFEFRSF